MDTDPIADMETLLLAVVSLDEQACGEIDAFIRILLEIYPGLDW